MQPAALQTPRKRCQTWPGQADKNFQHDRNFGGTIFSVAFFRVIVALVKNTDYHDLISKLNYRYNS